MKAAEIHYLEFLEWALPRLELRWPGFRKVRRQVIKRIARRLSVLQLPDVDAYRAYLADHHLEWAELDRLCRVTISRFYHDRRIFDILGQEGLPELIDLCRGRGEQRLRCWSAGCGAGEEAYTLVLIWTFLLAAQAPDLSLAVAATDADRAQIARACSGCYAPSSLRDLPAVWREAAFTEQEGRYCIRPHYRRPLTWGGGGLALHGSRWTL